MVSSEATFSLKFVKIELFLHNPANKQTNGQTNADENITSLEEVKRLMEGLSTNLFAASAADVVEFLDIAWSLLPRLFIRLFPLLMFRGPC